MRISIVALALITGCLTAEKKGDGTNIGPGGPSFVEGDGGADATGPGDVTAPDATAGGDTGAAPGDASLADTVEADTATVDTTAGEDSTPTPDVPVEPDVPDLGCPGIVIDGFGLAGSPKYLRFGEAAQLGVVLTAGDSATVSVTVSPPAMGQFFTPAGEGEGTFVVDQVDRAFRTTTVTFTLTVSDGGCSTQRTATVKVLGNVWVTEITTDVVEVFRSDGTFISQGIPSTYFSGQADGNPWSLLELDAGRIAVGSRHQPGVEVFDPEGNHLYSFDTKDKTGLGLYSIWGAYTMLRHQPDGRIWVGGPSEKLLVYEDDGTYVETISFGFQGPQAECLIQLPSLQTVLCDDGVMPWGLYALDKKGAILGDYGDNTTSIPLTIYRGAAAPKGVILGGRHTVSGAGYLVLLEPAGQLSKKSAPIEDWKPQYGVTAFGEGFLVATAKLSSNDVPLAHFDGDLKLVTETWTDRAGTYRGVMVRGGN